MTRGPGGRGEQDTGINQIDLEDVYELSPMQQGILFHTLYDPVNDVYLEQSVVTLRGKLDVARFAEAWRRVAERHSILRTSFHWEDLEKPVQVVQRDARVSLDVRDWRALPGDERSSRLAAFLEEDRGRSFDLTSAPLWRVALLQTEDDVHECVLSFQHLLLDRWSRLLLFKEIFTLYAASVSGNEAALPRAPSYSEYIAWLQKQDRNRTESFWRGTLAGFSAPTPLRSVGASAAGGGSGFTEASGRLSPDQTARLQALARNSRVTLNSVIQGAWAILASRYSGQDDVVFGVTVSGRPPGLPGVETMVGLFINTVPFRVAVPRETTAREFLQAVQRRFMKLREYEYSALLDVQGWSEVPRGTPLFDSLVVFENIDSDFDSDAASGGLKVVRTRGFGGRTNFPLTLVVNAEPALALRVFGEGGIFDPTTLSRMLGHLETLLDAMTDRPEQSVSNLPILTDAERRQILDDWNRRPATNSPTECLHRRFEAQADRAPESIAVEFDGQTLGYRELNLRANRLARHLRRFGVGAEVLVGVLLEPSLDLVVALMAVLKAGGAYVPLDPTYPPERIGFMLEDAQAVLLVTDGRAAESLEVPAGVLSVRIDADAASIAGEDGQNLDHEDSPTSLAYLIYTSGSTGQPKGVLVAHANVDRLFTSTEPWFRFDERDVWTLFHSHAFDFSVWELWGALRYGGRLVVVPRSVARSADAFHHLLAASGVTVLNQTPSAFRQLIPIDASSDTPLGLRLVIFGGEALDAGMLAPWLERHGCETPRLVNMYGITETTVHVTYHPMTSADVRKPFASVIGRPIPDLQVLVLDDELRLCPIGVSGELCIAGAGLARGYLRRPDLTARKFIRNPFAEDPADHLYRSGDLGRFLPDGNIEYLGRIDDQVKIRGFRIELGEVESVLARHPSVAASAVIVREDASGDKRLVAYVVGPGGSAPAASELRPFLKRTLPEYMVPSSYIALEKLPMTSTGKLDRRALPEPGETHLSVASFVAPRNPVEEMLAGIWAHVLRLPSVGIDDDFFSLGGHSLIATQVISRIRDAFGVELPLRSLFESPTVAGLAELIVVAQGEGSGAASPPLVSCERSEKLPLSFAQQRLWFLDQFEAGNAFYNAPLLLRLAGELHVDALEGAFHRVIARQDSLRTRFDSMDGNPVQTIEVSVEFRVARVDLTGLAEPQREAAAAARIAEDAAFPFNLEKAPLLRATLYRLDPREHLLLVTTHHIVSDGWSMDVFMRELAAFYEELSTGKPAALPRLPIQYADFAEWQRRWLSGEVLESQLSYWKERLVRLPVLELPTDRPRPPVQSHRGARCSLSLSNDLAEGLRRLSRREGVTLYMTLLSAFQTLLTFYTGQEDIVVGSPIAGRTRAEVEGLIGFFVNALVLRTSFSGDPSFREVLGRVRQVTLGAYTHQDLPFEKLVEHMHPDRNLASNPLFQVLFAVQNTPAVTVALTGLEVVPLAVDMPTTRFDLEAYVSETPSGLVCTFVYATDLFEPETIVRMMSHYQRLLESVVEDATRPLSRLTILTATERRQILEDWNRTEKPYPRDRTVPALFERQAEKTPERTAVVARAARLTYRELNERANRLAWYLKDRRVGPEVLVGLCVERSPEMLVGLLGILKAGGAYVPLDPTYPRNRLEFMLGETAAPVVVTLEPSSHSLPAGQFEVVRLDSDWPRIAAGSVENPPAIAAPENLAYVLYTSGTTGRPKGVAIEHRSTVGLLAWAREAYSDLELQGTLASTSINFDLSVFEIFAPLCWGGTVHLAQNALELADLPTRGDVTLVNTVPSVMKELLGIGALPRSVATVNLAGEPLSASLVREILRGGTAERRLLDLYGPTEDTTYSTCATRFSEGPVTIGRPISNKRIYILDRHLRPVPVGVPGDLYTAGVGVARGYLHRVDLTAERFLADPFRPGERMYRTGDRARFLPDGNVQYLGRLDQQVKVRGFRIELGEVEEVLAQHPRVGACALTAWQSATGDKRLIAYIAPRIGEEAPPVSSLRDFMAATLPYYMIPSTFIFLEALPLSPNGKVDRRALPDPSPSSPERETAPVPPRTRIERTIAEIWEQVLGVERVGVHDNFFDLGGHSLLATLVFARLLNAFPISLPLRTLFEKPTVAELAETIELSGEIDPAIRRSPIAAVSREAMRGDGAPGMRPAGPKDKNRV
ncbi:MAG: amino acid adenylation domain-containing protein [Acidobacteriota bacterium]